MKTALGSSSISGHTKPSGGPCRRSSPARPAGGQPSSPNWSGTCAASSSPRSSSVPPTTLAGGPRGSRERWRPGALAWPATLPGQRVQVRNPREPRSARRGRHPWSGGHRPGRGLRVPLAAVGPVQQPLRLRPGRLAESDLEFRAFCTRRLPLPQPRNRSGPGTPGRPSDTSAARSANGPATSITRSGRADDYPCHSARLRSSANWAA